MPFSIAIHKEAKTEMQAVNHFYPENAPNMDRVHVAMTDLLPNLAQTRLIHSLSQEDREMLYRGRRNARIEEVASSLHTGSNEPFRDPWFYRDFSSLRELHSQRPFRIWYPFVGNGSELRSLLVILENLPEKPDYYVEATDLDASYLKFTDTGAHPEIGPEVLTAFRKTGVGSGEIEIDGLRRMFESVSEIARSRVRFSRIPYDDPAPPGGPVDAVLLRNVLCNWKAQMRQTILQKVFAHLKTGGFLCVGYRETALLPPVMDRLSVHSASESIYRRVS